MAQDEEYETEQCNAAQYSHNYTNGLVLRADVLGLRARLQMDLHEASLIPRTLPCFWGEAWECETYSQ